MPHYFSETNFSNRTYDADELNFHEFEECTFFDCNFSSCNFIAMVFIDCRFTNCSFNEAKIGHTAFRSVHFEHCKIKDVNFAMAEKFIFEVHFSNCILDFSKFYALKMNSSSFADCSLVAADFMAADLTGLQFYKCDLYRAEFSKAVANKSDFSTSYNYTIDPEATKIKKAMFNKIEAKGLLYKHEVIIT
ncbi:MAG TPA: pentapeptide repeat-containing protein [Flavobacterium sp.]|jgi:uncharacterized protein YjbI with pentapeptide repeats